MLTKETTLNLSNFVTLLKTRGVSSQISFYCGSLISESALVCKALCPYSKLVALYTKSSFKNYGEALSERLKANGLSPLNIVLERAELEENLEQIILALPENARISLTLDKELIKCCQTLAKSRELECVIGLDDFPSRLFEITNPPPTSFIFEASGRADLSLLYQEAVNKIVSLIDIKLKQFLNFIPKREDLTDNFIELLDKALNVYDLEEGEREQKLIEWVISLEMLELAFCHIPEKYDFKTALCIVKLLAKNLSAELLSVPDYRKRAQKVEKLYDIKYLQTLKAFKAQLSELKAQKENLYHIRKGLSALAKEYATLAPRLVCTFKAFNGECKQSEKQILERIKYAGDMHFYNNSLSLLREVGYLEKIKV